MQKKDIKQRIREYFFVHPTARLRVRQIEREVRVPLPSAIRYAKELEKEGLLESETVGGMKLYSADRMSPIFLLEKKLFNIRQLYMSGFVDYLIRHYFNPTIILFGSYQKGEDMETSDIDVVVFTTAQIDIREELSQFEQKLQRDIQLFCCKSIEEFGNPDVVNSIMNGIVLNGFIEIFHEKQWMGRMQEKRHGNVGTPEHSQGKVIV